MVSCFMVSAMSRQPPVDTSTYYLQRTDQPSRLDPARAYDTASRELIQNIVQTLIWWNNKPVVPFTPGVGTNLTIAMYADLYSYGPILATALPTIVQNASGEYYTFTINTNALFQPWTAGNGTIIPPRNLTAADVVYSFRRQMVYDSPYGPTWMWFEPAFGFVGFSTELVGGPFSTYANGTFVNAADELSAGSIIQSWCYISGPNQVSFHFQVPWNPDILNQIFASTYGSIVEPEWVMEHGGWNGQFAAGWTNLWHMKPTATRSEIDQWKDPAIYGPAGSKYPGSNKHVNELIGTGPYLFTSLDQANKVWRIDKFAAYWGGWSGNHVNTVIEKTVDDWQTTKMLFLEGEFDEIQVPPARIAELATGSSSENPDAGINLVYNIAALRNEAVLFTMNVSSASSYQSYVGYPNHQTGAVPLFFANEHIRRAFAWAVNYTGTNGYVPTTYSWEAINLTSWWIYGLPPSSFQNTTLTVRDNNYDNYKNMTYELSQAVIDGINVSSAGFETTLLYNNGNEERKSALDLIARNFQLLNPKYKVNVKGLDWPVFLDAMNSMSMPGYTQGKLADFADALDFAMTYMYSHVSFPISQGPPFPADQTVIDNEIEAAMIEQNFTQLGLLYKDLQAKYYEDVISFVLVQPIDRRWTRDWVQGWYYNALLPGDYFYDLYKSVTALQNVDVALMTVTPATPTPNVTYIFHNQMRIGNGNANPDLRNYILNVTRNDFNGAIGSLYATVSLTYTSATDGKQAANSTIVTLMPGGSASASMIFWADGTDIVMAGNSTGIPYAIVGETWPINSNVNDTNPANNVQPAGILIAKTLPGDVTGNGLVDIYDAIQLANAFGSKQGDKRYNADADCNGDGNIDIYDAIILAAHFNQHVP